DRRLLADIGIYGYLNAVIAGDSEVHFHDFFDFRTRYLDLEDARLLGRLHGALVLGVTSILEMFPAFTSLNQIVDAFDAYRFSYLRSSIEEDSDFRSLLHLGAAEYIREINQNLPRKVDIVGIVVFESDSLKDVEIHINKAKIPLVQIIGTEKIDFSGVEIPVSKPFVWAATFRNHDEAVIIAQKTTLKKSLTFLPRPPTILKFDVLKEVKEFHYTKGGTGIKFFETLWIKDDSIATIMEKLANVSSNELIFESFHEFTTIFKKLGRKDVFNALAKLVTQAIPLHGEPLRLVALQRLLELAPDDERAIAVMSHVINK
ncbi:MAG TPA: hypothetical protein VJ044_15515, partial [Candidatus Hodarchaeales archaeon]|nr:hypothetical protein [Candidatus Hodarchaeales archaeon]